MWALAPDGLCHLSRALATSVQMERGWERQYGACVTLFALSFYPAGGEGPPAQKNHYEARQRPDVQRQGWPWPRLLAEDGDSQPRGGRSQRALLEPQLPRPCCPPGWAAASPLTPLLLPPGNLWYRGGITPSYPQGSSWEHVSNNVRRVSVGPLDQVGTKAFPSCPQLTHCTWAGGSSRSVFQVWVIANKVQGSHGLSRGTVCRRTGVQPREPKGQGWDYGIGVSGRLQGGLSHTCAHRAEVTDLGDHWVPGDMASSFQGGWDHISVRANATRAPRSSSREQEAHGPVCC
jgi:hypothetical protein